MCLGVSRPMHLRQIGKSFLYPDKPVLDSVNLPLILSRDQDALAMFSGLVSGARE